MKKHGRSQLERLLPGAPEPASLLPAVVDPGDPETPPRKAKHMMKPTEQKKKIISSLFSKHSKCHLRSPHLQQWVWSVMGKMWGQQVGAAARVTIEETHGMIVGKGQRRMVVREVVGVILLIPDSVRRRWRVKMLMGRPLLLPVHSWEHRWWEIKLFISSHRPGRSNQSVKLWRIK